MPTLLQGQSRVSIVMWYTCDNLPLHLPGFHSMINQNATYQIAKAITCKHCTCCIHVIAFATTLTFLQMPGSHILINLKVSVPRNVSIVAKAITCKHCTCCKRLIAFATMLTFLHFPGFHILINQNTTYQEMSKLLQKLSRVDNIHVVYT